jgi:crotonobetainyl-CoA:carnitine CoA-transferase CaiB-like acyl-CoA transferase
MTAVMEGVRILEVAEHTFTPLAAGILSDWGATVIKIEHVERGDAMRGLGSTGGLQVGGGGVHMFMEHANRGKQSLALDLTTDQGRDLLYRLAATCDVFLTNKLPAVAAKLKVDVEDIRAHNPGIIYARGTGYGPDGPDRDLGAYDWLGFWARSGIAASMRAHGAPLPPGPPGPAFGDSLGAMVIAGGISAALFHRAQTGEAAVVDVSLLASGMWAMGAAIGLSQLTGVPKRPPVSDGPPPLNPIVGEYATSDGYFISLCMLQAFRYWPEVARVLGHPEWITDERFDSHERLQANSGAARELVSAEFAKDTFESWKLRLKDLKGQWAPVQDTVNIADDPMVQANGYLLETTSHDGIPFTMVSTPVMFDKGQRSPGRAPAFNEHGDEILARELGLDDEAIIALKIAGVVA